MFANLKSNKFSFLFSISRQKNFNPSKPINNGGINALDKNTIKSYANNMLSSAEESLKKRTQLIKSVKDLKDTVEQNSLLKMNL